MDAANGTTYVEYASSKFFANRTHDVVAVRLAKIHGHACLSIDEDRIGGRGHSSVTITLGKLPDLIRAIRTAEKKARELKPLDDSGPLLCTRDPTSD
jgi:hypothetical protein